MGAVAYNACTDRRLSLDGMFRAEKAGIKSFLTHSKACLDVLHGRQVACRGQASEQRRQAMGA